MCKDVSPVDIRKLMSMPSSKKPPDKLLEKKKTLINTASSKKIVALIMKLPSMGKYVAQWIALSPTHSESMWELTLNLW